MNNREMKAWFCIKWTFVGCVVAVLLILAAQSIGIIE